MNILSLKIRFRIPVKCRKCGVVVWSDIKYLELGSIGLEDVQSRLQLERVGHDFPEGWAGYGDSHECPECWKKGEPTA